jgi:glycine/D-amino acid oxidase-like deaminating enzyme
MQDAVIIGGGFYGSVIAIYLARQRGLKNITLIEQESELLSRASRNNQARVHNGYHYPRSLITAYRSHVNLSKFIDEYSSAINHRTTMLYAIANNSKTNAKQFVNFCKTVGIKIRTAETSLRALFNQRLIENVFLVEEYIFDCVKLLSWIKNNFLENRISVNLKSCVTSISQDKSQSSVVNFITEEGVEKSINCRYIFNCTYSGINRFKGVLANTVTNVKHEIAELALIHPPKVIEGMGITVMDGPFFSILPFPIKKLHSLSHVRYTPHMSWEDETGIDPYQKLANYKYNSLFNRMIRDAGKYLPAILDSDYVESIFEVKTVLSNSEIDDGRPIVFNKHSEINNCFTILGGKVDNIYDVLKRLEDENIN